MSDVTIAQLHVHVRHGCTTFVVCRFAGIKPELYQRKDSILRLESKGESVGRLQIRLKFDFNTSDLLVHLIQGALRLKSSFKIV